MGEHFVLNDAGVVIHVDLHRNSEVSKKKEKIDDLFFATRTRSMAIVGISAIMMRRNAFATGASTPIRSNTSSSCSHAFMKRKLKLRSLEKNHQKKGRPNKKFKGEWITWYNNINPGQAQPLQPRLERCDRQTSMMPCRAHCPRQGRQTRVGQTTLRPGLGLSPQ